MKFRRRKTKTRVRTHFKGIKIYHPSQPDKEEDEKNDNINDECEFHQVYSRRVSLIK